MAKKRKTNKKNLPRNGSQNNNKQRNINNTESITIKGEHYLRLYDENGNVTEDLSSLGFDKDEIEKRIEELSTFGLMEIVERNGIKFYRMIEPRI